MTGLPGGLRVLAVDDEQPALDELAYLLRRDPRIAEVHTAADASGALRAMEDHDLDAVFLDVRMPELTGVDLAHVLARFAQPPAVVFVTAYDEHAVAAFDVGALDYLLKPVRAERLSEAVRRIADTAADPAAGGMLPTPRLAADLLDHGLLGDTIPVELGGTVRFVSRADVAYVEAAGDYARLHTSAGGHLVRVPLTTLEEQWADGFVRIHRSYLVSLRHIEELRFDGTHYLVRVGGQELQVSRRHGRELRDRLVRHARPGAARHDAGAP